MPEKRAADYLFTSTLLSTGEFINVKKPRRTGLFTKIFKLENRPGDFGN